MPGMRLPCSSTITEGTPITKLPLPSLVCTLWMEWQVVQVRPSRSKERSSVEPVFNAPAKNPDRVVAAVAVARELNPLGADQDIDAGAVERRPEGVGVQRLTPLVVGLLVAVAAVGGVGKGAWLEKVPTFGGGVSGQRNLVFCEGEVVGLADLIRVGLANIGLLRAGVVSAADSLHADDRDDRKCHKKDDDASAKDVHTMHGWRRTGC